MEPPRPPSPPSGPPRGTCASRRNVEAPSPPSPARSQTFTWSRNIWCLSSHALAARPRGSSVVPQRIDAVRRAFPGIADPDFEVAVGTGRPAAGPDVADRLATRDDLANPD